VLEAVLQNLASCVGIWLPMFICKLHTNRQHLEGVETASASDGDKVKPVRVYKVLIPSPTKHIINSYGVHYVLVGLCICFCSRVVSRNARSRSGYFVTKITGKGINLHLIAILGLVPHTKWVDVYPLGSHAQLLVAVTRGNAVTLGDANSTKNQPETVSPSLDIKLYLYHPIVEST
jgi:hypothetical protein